MISTWFHSIGFVRSMISNWFHSINDSNNQDCSPSSSCWRCVRNQLLPIYTIWQYLQIVILSVLCGRGFHLILPIDSSINHLDRFRLSISDWRFVRSIPANISPLIVASLLKMRLNPISINFIHEGALTYAPHLSPCWRLIRINCLQSIPFDDTSDLILIRVVRIICFQLIPSI